MMRAMQFGWAWILLLLAGCRCESGQGEGVSPQAGEVRSYRVSLEALRVVEQRRAFDGFEDPFSEEEKVDERSSGEWEKVKEAGFESRFLQDVGVLRDASKWGEVIFGEAFKGKAVYDETRGCLVVQAEAWIHDEIAELLASEIGYSIRTRVSIYEMLEPGFRRGGKLVGEMSEGAKLLGSLTSLGSLGQTTEARSRDGTLAFELESHLDNNEMAYSENRFSFEFKHQGKMFSWMTGFSVPLGVNWAQEAGVVDGETLVMVFRQDLMTPRGESLDEIFLKEDGGAFLVRERLEKMRWKDPEKRKGRDMTKAFHVFETMPLAMYFETKPGVQDLEELPKEMRDIGVNFYDLKKVLEGNGLNFRDGDFAFYGLAPSGLKARVYARLSEENLDFLEMAVEAGRPELPRVIGVEIREVLEDGTSGRGLAIPLGAGQIGSMNLGGDLSFEVEAQTDVWGELVELRATLSEDDGDSQRVIFSNGMAVQSGQPVLVHESWAGEERRAWEIKARVRAMDREVNEYLKREEQE